MLSINSSTDRNMARVALVIFCGGLIYGFYSLGGPVYWRFYATVLRPFEDGGIDLVHDIPANKIQPGLLEPDKLKAVDKPKDPPKVQQPAAVVQKPPEEKPKVEPVGVPPATGKKPYNPDDYPLSKERVHALLQDGVIMITWANQHYLDFAKSWVYHVRKVGVTGYMVGAMDDEMLKDLYELDIHTWRMNTGITKNDLGWGSPNFHKMGRAKISLIKQFLDLDVTLVISDIDTAWTKNPLPYFARYPEADVLTSSDELGPTVSDDSLELFPNAGSAFNIGIMLFRQKSVVFVEEWIKILEDPKMWDQTAFNDLSRKGATHSEPPKNLFKGYNGQLTVGVLPVALFASGHTFFVQTKYKELGLEPYVAHATFQYSGTPGKRHRFREALLWDDPPEYFDHPKGFINFKMDIPPDMLAAASTQIEGGLTKAKLDPHFTLVHHQLKRIRDALAIATITGRVIILPPVLCQIDKYWAPLWNGNIPGSKFIKPFICPMDHVFDLEGGWFPKHGEDHWGPHIEWREYSFLNNSRLTPAVRDSRVVIEVCPPGQDGCNNGDVPLARSGDAPLKLSAQLNSQQLATALGGLQDVKILDFTTMADVFTNFVDQAAQDRWEVRLKHYTSVVCCLGDNPGWLWYDFFFDRPHTDRLGRKFDGGPWVYKRGDSNVEFNGRRLLEIGDSALPLDAEDAAADLVSEKAAVGLLARRMLQGAQSGVGSQGRESGLSEEDGSLQVLSDMGMSAMRSIP